MDNKDFLIKEETLTNIADSIRDVDSTLDKMTPTEMSEEIKRLTAVIDQRYNASSTNPQAGIAVAEGIQQERERAQLAEDQNEQNIVNETTERKQADNELQSQIDNIESSSVGKKTENGGEIFNDYDTNKALGKYSATFGSNNTSGCSGFKVSNFVKGGYDTEGHVYYAKVTLNTDDSHFANIAVGDKVSVRINYNSNGLTVTAVDTTNKVVTLNNILETFPDFVASDDNYLWVVEKPEVGDTPIGIGAFAGGFTDNHANQDGAFAIGRRNIADGRWSVALGSDNKAGYSSVAMGKGNNILRGENSAVFGQGNQVTVYDSSSLISGSGNTINQSGSSLISGSGNTIKFTLNAGIVAGSANTVEGLSRHSAIFGTNNNLDTGYCNLISGAGLKSNNKPYQTILGCYNKETEALFAVGVGSNDADRRNAIEINRDGTAEIYTQGTEDKSIVQKQYVDKVKTDVTALDNTVKSLAEQKLNKQTYTDGKTRVYVATGDGHQGALVADNNTASVSTIPIRNTNGTIIINEPKADDEAANKQYVDTLTSSNEQHITEESLKRENADKELETKITSNSETITKEVSNRENADKELDIKIDTNSKNITNEISNREKADSNLQTQITANKDNLTQEISDRETADTELSKKITANSEALTKETADRKSADENLAQQIANITAVQIRNKSEVINSTEAEVQTIATQYMVTNYQRQPQNFDGLIITVTDKNNDKILYIYSEVSKLWINSGINDVDLSNYYTKSEVYNKNEIDTKVDTLNTSITTEIEARTNADTTLGNKITKEVSDRESAVKTVSDNLDTEVTNRTNADTVLDTKISANSKAITKEISDRSDADKELSNKITSNSEKIAQEISDRTNADTTLQSNIDKEVERATKAEQANETLITTETNERKSAITNLNKQIVSFDIYSSKTDFITLDVLIPAKEI